MQKGTDDDEDEVVKPSWSPGLLTIDLPSENCGNLSTSCCDPSQTPEADIGTTHDMEEAALTTPDMLPLKSISRWPLFVPSWLLKKVERFSMEDAFAVFNTNDSG